jgi:hypothetical protein
MPMPTPFSCCCCRGEPSIKVAALNLMAAAVEGLGNNDRNVLTVHAEALKTADKYAKDKYSDKTLRQVRSTWIFELTTCCLAITWATTPLAHSASLLLHLQ